MRPIFSMYPDWPGLYGSDNDELSNPGVDVQVAELGDDERFRRDVAGTHPRYAPLLQEAAVARVGRRSTRRFRTGPT